jgi:hypothetical protein
VSEGVSVSVCVCVSAVDGRNARGAVETGGRANFPAVGPYIPQLDP